jgi:nitrate reductase (NAD(P)H)
MMRLRDPVTREAIIRSYTPISETAKRGYADVLVKVYLDGKDRKGGKMTQAIDALPIGHFVDFKGPIGKFEYLGRGLCAINGISRTVKRFIMICGGSGITPIFQVLRAVMNDKEDPTKCVVLDGNRLAGDILCKEGLDTFARENLDRCKLLYTLTKAPDGWQGLRGRIAGPLLKEYCCRSGETESMVLICGPEALEKSVHIALNEQGWPDSDLMFF